MTTWKPQIGETVTVKETDEYYKSRAFKKSDWQGVVVDRHREFSELVQVDPISGKHGGWWLNVNELTPGQK